MSTLFHSAASAALPVAIVLLVLGASARAVLWAQIDDPRWARIARQYLAPLSTWSVAAFITYALTLVAAGEAVLVALQKCLLGRISVSAMEGVSRPHAAHREELQNAAFASQLRRGLEPVDLRFLA